MELFDKYSPQKLLLISLVFAVFTIYPNIAFFAIEHEYLGKTGKQTAHILFFIFRYLFFSGVIWSMLMYNQQRLKSAEFRKRIIHTLVLTLISYIVYIGFSALLSPKPEWYSGMLLFQFFVMFLFSTLIGHVAHLYSQQRRKEQEIEQLKVENLQSRFDALTNQINPHFFFNSLNGLTSLIRKKNEENTLAYVNKLSDVFRYILQSDKKALVTLEEELSFVRAFSYMMEIRFASKLIFKIDIDESKKELRIPVLSLLPLLDNIVVHNTIDSDHKMVVRIWLNENGELVVSNPVFPKLVPSATTGTGLKNLESRFILLMNRQVRVENDGKIFSIYLPLK